MWSRSQSGLRRAVGCASRSFATASSAAILPARSASQRSAVVARRLAFGASVALGCTLALASSSSSNDEERKSFGAMRWMRAMGTRHAQCAGAASNSTDASDEDDDHRKHLVATKTWHYYSGPGGDLSNLRLFSGNSNRELATEIAHYLGVQVNKASVGQFEDGECRIQVHDHVRGAHCFVIQPVSAPVNDSLMELLLLISTLRRASAAEITAVVPYYGYERADRKLSSRTPISAADVALMMEEMGVDRVVAVDLHGGQIQGFFPPSVPVENLESMPIGALYFSEKHLRKPVVVAASAGGVLRAKRFRETLVEQGIDTDMAMLIEAREADDAGRFDADSKGRMDLVGNVKGCDCILVEDIVDTASTIQHAAVELKRQGSRHVYAFCTHGLFSSPESGERIASSPIRELVTTNTVHMRPQIERIDKITQLTLAPLLAETIRRIYQKRSISGLYQSPIAAPASAASEANKAVANA